MLSRPAEIVRKHDPDRFLTSLFAPADRREALLVLYAFNHELARAREVASEPTLALIRLQWWRDVVTGQTRRHEVAEPLAASITAGRLRADDLLALVDARESEAEPAIPTFEAWQDYLLAGAGGLAVAAGRLLGAPEPEALRHLGAAYGVTGMLRNVAALARQGRCLLPLDLLAAHGLTAEAVIADPAPNRLAKIATELRAVASDWLGVSAGLRLPRSAIAAALPAVLARRDLRGSEPVPRGLGARLAVTFSGLTGRF